MMTTTALCRQHTSIYTLVRLAKILQYFSCRLLWIDIVISMLCIEKDGFPTSNGGRFEAAFIVMEDKLATYLTTKAPCKAIFTPNPLSNLRGSPQPFKHLN